MLPIPEPTPTMDNAKEYGMSATLAQRAATFEMQPYCLEALQALTRIEAALQAARYNANYTLSTANVRAAFDHALAAFNDIMQIKTKASIRAQVLSAARENYGDKHPTPADLDMILSRAYRPIARYLEKANSALDEISELKEELYDRMGRLECLVRLEYEGALLIFADSDDLDDDNAANGPAKITDADLIAYILGHSDITTLERAALNRKNTEIRIGIDSNQIVTLFPTWHWQAAR